ncbi:MAG: LPS export ABC transporter permease LptG [Mangrovicoccus sp.]|nr:LPS export ABC transporter permease LptG [Mangrovicoccus sp.]
MILDLYFARRFLITFLGILLGFVAFMWLVEMLEHIRRFEGDDIGLPQLSYLAVLHIPQVLYEVTILVILLATLLMFVTLARTSELVITRATGRSAMRSLMAPLITSFLIGLAALLIMNPLVAATSKLYEREINALRGEERVVSVGSDGLWLRQGAAMRQTAIHADSSNLDGTVLYGVSFYGFDGQSNPTFRIEAEQAELRPEGWYLSRAKKWDFSGIENPEIEAEDLAHLVLPSSLTRDQIRDSFGTPSSIPIWDLPGFIARLETSGFSARAHRVWFQSELARPLSFVAMVLIGAVFTLRHTRFGRTGLMVLGAVLAGFLLYFVTSLTHVMGENGQVPIALAVWSPPIAAILLALSLLLHLEDG